MMRLLLLLLLTSCGANVDYLTGNVVCDSLEYNKGFEAFPCYNILTGRRVERIYNPTNVIEIPEDERLWK